VGDSRRSFVMHVYTQGRCTVEDVRTGVVVAVEDMARLGERIATLLVAGGEERPDRDPVERASGTFRAIPE